MVEAGCRLGSPGAFGGRRWGLLRVLLPLISICPAHGAVASGAPHVTHGPLCVLCFLAGKPAAVMDFHRACGPRDVTLCAPHRPLSAAEDAGQESGWNRLESSAQSQSHRRTAPLRAPTSSSLISTLLSADTPPLSASVWFPSCCSNLFMLNLDLQLLACEAFAFSWDFCCSSFKSPASEYWDCNLTLRALWGMSQWYKSS